MRRTSVWESNVALMLETVGYARVRAGKNVRVNASNPGMTRTRQLVSVPVGRMAEREEKASVAVFLIWQKQVTSPDQSFPGTEERFRRSQRPASWRARGNDLALVDQ